MESRLRLMAADGTGSRPLGDESSGIGGFEASGPAVSPDGRSVAFIRGRDAGNVELWVSGFDGSGARPLVGPLAYAPFLAHPAWTPDGRSIYLTIDDSVGGDSGIYRVDVATRALARVEDCTADNSPFALSRDGTRIVYQCDSGLWLADTDFTDARRWYGSVLQGHPLDWSPDGRWIAYAPPDALYLLDTTVADPTPIALEPAEQPRWRPRPAP